ncbi:MAG: OmpA family protein [Bryobacteraceae bacterium]
MNRIRRTILLVTMLLAALTLASSAALAQTKIQGVITGRSGATMTLQVAGSPDVVVLLTDTTQVEEAEGLFKARSKQMGMTALIPGLPVQVQGTTNAQGQLVADTVRFKGTDLKAAQDAQAGLQPTMQAVAANKQQIQQSQQEIAAQQAALAKANQLAAEQQAALQAQRAAITEEEKKTAANKAAIAAANKRFGELGQYNILGEATVYFANGKVTVDQKFVPQLLALAKQAKGITAYIIQVQGYASAVGSAALNQKLSAERAQNVLNIMIQQGQIPLTNVLAPGAMGTADQVAPDSSVEGQAENRRVVVRILQDKGIAGN